MWSLTDERQITGLARASRSLRAPCAAISPVVHSSAAQQNPLDAPPSSSSSSSFSPGLWRGSCLLTGGVSGDEPRCKHSVSLTEVCRVRVQFFACPFSATAPRHQLIECGAVLTAECPPLCLPNKDSLCHWWTTLFFFSPPLALWMWRGGHEMFKSTPSYSPLFLFKGTFSAVEGAHPNLPRAQSREVFVHSAIFRRR